MNEVQSYSSSDYRNSSYFFKCGEILCNTFAAVVEEDRNRIYVFNCVECEILFDDLLDLTRHFEAKHFDDLLPKTIEEVVEDGDDIDLLAPSLKEDVKVVESQAAVEYKIEYLEGTSSAQLETIENDVDAVVEEVEGPIKLFEDAEALVTEGDNVAQLLAVENDDCSGGGSNQSYSYVTVEHVNNGVMGNSSKVDNYDDVGDACDEFDCQDDDDSIMDVEGDYEENDELEGEEEEEEDANATASADEKILKLAIIIAYEKHPVLWNSQTSSSRKYRSLREEALTQITKSINSQLKLQLTVDDVRNAIKQVATSYRNEMQKQKLANLNGGKTKPPWYFDKLKFLERKNHDDAENNEENAVRKSLTLPISTLDAAQHATLFEIFKKFPSLWDVHNVGFHTKKLRDKALADMTVIVNEQMDLDYTAAKLQRKLYRIRYACSKEKYRKLECERNGRPYRPSSKCHEQIAFIEEHVSPFKCPYCDKVFGYAHKFVLHRAEHDGSLPYKCSICQHGFKLAANCVVHMRRHTQELPYACKECGKAFASSTEVTLHMRHHSGERPFVCEVCGRSYFTPTSLEYHKRRHVNDRSFQCAVCCKAFYDNYQLGQHMKCHLNKRDKVCDICGKAFNLGKHLRQHMQIHAEKKYVCKICGKNFAQSAGLSGHMKTHGKKKTSDDIFDTQLAEEK